MTTPISTTAPVSVPANSTETNVLTYANTAGCNLQGYAGTGDGPGRFVLRVGGASPTSGTLYYPYRTSPSDRNANMVFPAFNVPANTPIYINVANDEDTAQRNYEATLMLA